MNKTKTIGILTCFVVILLTIFTFLLILNQQNNRERQDKLCSELQEIFDLITLGKTLEANMNFVDNYENKEINKVYNNLSKDELIEKGYMEYIQSTDYMIEFYKIINITDIEFDNESDNKVEFKVSVERPNSSKIMNECDSENMDNPNYDFNETFIGKIKNQDFEVEKGTYRVVAHKAEGNLKLEYNDNFKELLYSKN